MIGDLAHSGAPGADRQLLQAVFTEADQRNWTLGLTVRPDRPELITLYQTLNFTLARSSRPG